MAGTSFPVAIDSTNSNGNKIAFRDNGAPRGFIGAAANVCFLVTNSDGAARRLTVLDTGNVGINTTSPDSSLHVNGAAQVTTLKVGLGPRQEMTYSAGSGYTVTHDVDDIGYELAVGSDSRGVRWTQNGTELMRIDKDGNVGIGTQYPEYPLTVAGATDETWPGSDDRGFQAGDDHLKNFASGSISVRVTDGVWANFFLASSDRRIKRIVGHSDGAADLERIKALAVTDYTMVDTAQHGGAPRKGLIAQEVRDVMPEAVSKGTGYLPDVYAHATAVDYDASAQHCTVTMAEPHGLAAGDRVRIFHADGSLEVDVVAVPEPTRFVVATKQPLDKVFVYGKKVDDFLSVDYDRVFTTAVSALQELKREKDAEIAALRERLAELESRDAAREARLDAIETLLRVQQPGRKASASASATIALQ